LKYIFYLFLYLNIYSALSTEVKGQELYLSVKAEEEKDQSLIDSLQLQEKFKNYRSLKEEVDGVSPLLQRLGFIESELIYFDKKNDSTYTANFHLGNRYTSIKVYYDEADFSKKELSQISPEVTSEYFILPFSAIERSLQKLNAFKTQKGNAFARTKLNEISKENDLTLKASLNIENGNQRIIDSITVKGYEKFPKSFLKYYAGIKKGNLFNKTKLNTQNEVLNSLGFATSIKPPEALFRKDSTIVYFYLEKQNNNLFDGILGFATDEKTQKIKFNGYLNLELNNNLNHGEQLSINYKSDGNEQLSFNVAARLPYLFKSPFGMGLELKIFKRDSTFVTSEQQAKLTYQISPRANTYLGYKGYESNNLLDEAIAGISVEDYTSKFLTSGLSYQKTQNINLFPIKTMGSLETEIGKRDSKGSKENQIRFSIIANNIFNLNNRNSIFLQNETSILFTDTFLTNELFRFGGINSIRGFDENSIDSSLFSVINTEYRYIVNPNLYIHSIIDLAYFENNILTLKEQLYSVGFGIGLKSAAGILRLNIANGVTGNQHFNFSNTKIHLSLSSKF